MFVAGFVGGLWFSDIFFVFLFFCLFRELALLLCGRCSVGQVVFLCAWLLLGGRKKAWINAKLWTGRGG